MSAAHTPGPWLAREWTRHSPTTVMRERDGVPGRIQPIADVSSCGFASTDEEIANALLIAAAPDLLELAKRYASECGECAGTRIVAELDDVGQWAADVPCDDCAFIWETIDRAEGRT